MSTIASRFRAGEAGILTLVSGAVVSYGAIEVRDGNLLYYTGKGLREIFKPSNEEEVQGQAALKVLVNAKDWETLMLTHHVAELPLSKIAST